MSTAGKVLVVLVVLVIPIWIVLVAKVADINTKGAQDVQKLNDQLAKVEKQVEDNEQNITALKDKTALEQHAMERQIDVLRTRLTEVEGARSDMIEILKDVKSRRETVDAELEKAKLSRDQRVAELKAEREAMAAAEKDVTRLKTENADLLAQLTKLRDDFKSTVQSNRELAERLRKRAASPST